jgi:hypothetical protein
MQSRYPAPSAFGLNKQAAIRLTNLSFDLGFSIPHGLSLSHL